VALPPAAASRVPLIAKVFLKTELS
jgi:hypothetical protein